MAKKQKQVRVRISNSADKQLLHEAVKQEASRMITKVIEKEKLAMADRFIDVGVAALGNAMIDIFDVKGATLKAIIDKWVLQFECLADDYCTIDDLYDYIESEGGVKIERRCKK